jgi:hypothetical protein
MPRLCSIVLFWAIVSSISLTSFAQTPTCDKLKGTNKQLAGEILASQHPYDCCDDTIAKCLKKKPVCALAYRLAENVCRRVMNGEDKSKITRGISKRARTMLSKGKATIDLHDAPMAGDPKAPITLVEYACARCPYCGKITPKLHAAVTKGHLKEEVKLYFKTFPIRSHEYSKETGFGFIAAHKLGRFWEFLNYSYEHFDVFCIKKQAEWAAAAGMDPKKFEEIVADPVTRNLLVSSKKEGIVNKVDATPTFFINGRKYEGDINFDELVDVLEEEHDRLTKKKYR